MRGWFCQSTAAGGSFLFRFLPYQRMVADADLAPGQGSNVISAWNGAGLQSSDKSGTKATPLDPLPSPLAKQWRIGIHVRLPLRQSS